MWGVTQVTCRLKSAPSFGICRMMSSEPKIGSKYCQTPCTFSQMSSTSCIGGIGDGEVELVVVVVVVEVAVVEE